MYKLTDEGRNYLEKGLPEQGLAKILDKPLRIQDARGRVDNFNIALQWAKKRGWVKIEKGMLILARKPEKLPEEQGLERVSKNQKIDDKMLSLLLGRKLIEKERDSLKKARKMIGREVSSLTPELLKTGLWKKVKLRPYNVLARGQRLYPGKRQPYSSFLTSVRQKIVELGFQEMTGPIIELEFWNFDALYQAQNHPSRDWSQTYTLKEPKHGTLPDKKISDAVKAAHENGRKTGSTGWGYTWDPKKAAQLMPRAHDTAITPRILASKDLKVPGKYFQMVRCFRPDIIDATHGVEFNQMGGLVVGEELSFRKLLGLLKTFIVEITGFDKVRFRPDYFPFTEPSVEVSAKHPELGWVELAGAGMGRPELHQPLGMKEPVLMWGFGIDRLAMMKLNIHDIRQMFSQDLEWLRNSRMVLR